MINITLNGRENDPLEQQKMGNVKK